MGSKPQHHTGVITKKLQLTKTVLHFFVTVEKPEGFDFFPGQYGTFIIDAQTRRQYTFCSAPDPSSFELVVDVSPMGPGSQYFLGKKEGDRVEFLAPFGNFILSNNLLKKVFVATGTGIAPFRSMLLKEVHSSSFLVPGKKNYELVPTNQEPATKNFSLYWGLRYEDDMYWNDELEAFAGQLRGFQYYLTLSKPGPNWRGFAGHVTEHVLENEKNFQNSEFYLCGNNAMIKELKDKLSAQNVPKKQINIDLFY